MARIDGEVFAKAKDMLQTTTLDIESCARPEFLGAADSLVAVHSELPDRMRIEPYPVDVLAYERRREVGHRVGLSTELRNLDRYLEEIRRAASGECSVRLLVMP